MTRPTKITPDPIIDAVVELRYESAVPPDAILGMLFAQVKPKYSDFKKLPITTIPEAIRSQDPRFQFNPYYQAEAGVFKLNIGPRVISLSNTGQYAGWKEAYFPELQELLENVEKAGIVKHFSRVGVRYIDFFESDIYECTNLSIHLNDEPLDAIESTFSAIFKLEEFQARVQVANNVTVNKQDEQKIGSLIDTDTYKEYQDGLNFEGLSALIDRCHEESADFFFSLLKKDFLKTLNPEYAE